MGPKGMEAVGDGTIQIEIDAGDSPCRLKTKINDELTQSADVKDGDSIEISLITDQNCSCCEVGRNCNVGNAGFWVVKNNKEKGTTTIDRSQLDKRLKALALRMASRRSKLRG
jgi:hypothetical protein